MLDSAGVVNDHDGVSMFCPELIGVLGFSSRRAARLGLEHRL